MVNHLLETEDIESALEEVIPGEDRRGSLFHRRAYKSLKALRIIERKDSTYRIAKELQTVRILLYQFRTSSWRGDALPEGAKEVVQVGITNEREFSYKLHRADHETP